MPSLKCKGCGRSIKYDIDRDVKTEKLSEVVDEDDISYSYIYTRHTVTCPECGYNNSWVSKYFSY